MKHPTRVSFFIIMMLFIVEPAHCQTPEELFPSGNFSVSYVTPSARSHYHRRIASFKKNPLLPGDIVFLGDSITEQGGDWAAKLGNPKVKNRGIGGDVTEGVLGRLGEIFGTKPRAVFLLIGINDLIRGKTPEFVAENILEIAKRIYLRSPQTRVFIQTILPVQSPGKFSPMVRTINDILKSKASGATFTLIDLHSLYATKNDLFDDQYTDDGLHLTNQGYRPWVEKVRSLVNSPAP